MVEEIVLKNAIKDLRKLKVSLNDRLHNIFRIIDDSYNNALETIDSCIQKINIVLSLKNNPRQKQPHYYDCLKPVSNESTLIIIPTFPELSSDKLSNLLKLSELEGFFSIPDIKESCEHDFSYYNRSKCGRLHCFKCIKDEYTKNNDIEKIEEHLREVGENKRDFRDYPNEKKKEKIEFVCKCGINYTYRELFIIKYNIG